MPDPHDTGSDPLNEALDRLRDHYCSPPPQGAGVDLQAVYDMKTRLLARAVLRHAGRIARRGG